MINKLTLVYENNKIASLNFVYDNGIQRHVLSTELSYKTLLTDAINFVLLDRVIVHKEFSDVYVIYRLNLVQSVTYRLNILNQLRKSE